MTPGLSSSLSATGTPSRRTTVTISVLESYETFTIASSSPPSGLDHPRVTGLHDVGGHTGGDAREGALEVLARPRAEHEVVVREVHRYRLRHAHPLTRARGDLRGVEAGGLEVLDEALAHEVALAGGLDRHPGRSEALEHLEVVPDVIAVIVRQEHEDGFGLLARNILDETVL